MANHGHRCCPSGVEEEERPAPEDGCRKDSANESVQSAAVCGREWVDRVHEGRVHFAGKRPRQSRPNGQGAGYTEEKGKKIRRVHVTCRLL